MRAAHWLAPDMGSACTRRAESLVDVKDELHDYSTAGGALSVNLWHGWSQSVRRSRV